MNDTLWSNGLSTNYLTSLNKDIVVDVLIIGGGITGISTLYHLSNSSLNVCLVEKNTVGNGVTAKTTGKLTYLQENIYSKLSKLYSFDVAKLYYDSQKDSIEMVKNIIEKNKIDCDFNKSDSYIYSNHKQKINDEKKILNTLGIDFNNCDILPDNTFIKNGCYVKDTYVFHPLKYLNKLKEICIKKNKLIYENTAILKINKFDNYYECLTTNNKICAKYVVIASHYPYFIKPFFMPIKCYLEKSYISAYSIKNNYQFNSINLDNPTISIRFHTNNNINYKLFLTNSHNLCIRQNEKKNFNNLCKKIDQNYFWSNKDIITHDYIPFIGRIKKNSNLLIATGFNTWGMTNGSLAGKILADIILGNENKYTNLFSPYRKITLNSIKNLSLILVSNVYSFAKSKLKKQKNWYSNNVIFKKKNGKDIAIYIDENNKKHIVYNLCPHLKCGLFFNEVERIWECPCHGSRFNVDGKCIEGPSNYDIRYRE